MFLSVCPKLRNSIWCHLLILFSIWINFAFNSSCLLTVWQYVMTNTNSSNLVVFCLRRNCIYCFSCIACCIKKHWREVVGMIVFVHCRRNQHFCIVEKYKQKRRGIQRRCRTNNKVILVSTFL